MKTILVSEFNTSEKFSPVKAAHSNPSAFMLVTMESFMLFKAVTNSTFPEVSLYPSLQSSSRTRGYSTAGKVLPELVAEGKFQ
jgi:hypothetical protein